MTMKYKAIFFDRDNTLTYANPEKMKWRDELIERLSGKRFFIDHEKAMKLFDKAGYPKGGLKTVEEEKKFWKRYYYELLLEEGINEDLDSVADKLLNELWCNKDRLVFEEVIEVLEYFKGKGYRIGVISDTSPSLQLTLEQLGLGEYIESYTCSDIVGVGKPDLKIYNAALESLGVQAQESLYVDDYDVEVEGARNLGFTSFHIVRSNKKAGEWAISSLREIVEYVKKIDEKQYID